MVKRNFTGCPGLSTFGVVSTFSVKSGSASGVPHALHQRAPAERVAPHCGHVTVRGLIRRAFSFSRHGQTVTVPVLALWEQCRCHDPGPGCRCRPVRQSASLLGRSTVDRRRLRQRRPSVAAIRTVLDRFALMIYPRAGPAPSCSHRSLPYRGCPVGFRSIRDGCRLFTAFGTPDERVMRSVAEAHPSTRPYGSAAIRSNPAITPPPSRHRVECGSIKREAVEAAARPIVVRTEAIAP